jgi:hypothetical protein
MSLIDDLFGSSTSSIITDQSAAGQSSGSTITSAGQQNQWQQINAQPSYQQNVYVPSSSGSTGAGGLTGSTIATTASVYPWQQWQQYTPPDTFSVVLHKRLNAALKPEFLPEMLFQKLNEQYTEELINKLSTEMQQDEV